MNVEPTRADRLCRVFSSVIEDVVTTRALRQTVGNGLSRAQFGGLQYVYLHPYCCIKDLAQGLAVSHPAAVKLVERLTGKGLVARSIHADDKRMVQLVVSEIGEQHVRAAMGARSRAIAQIIEATDEGSGAHLLGCLDAFVRTALADAQDLDVFCLRCGDTHDDSCPVCQAEMVLTGRLRTDS